MPDRLSRPHPRRRTHVALAVAAVAALACGKEAIPEPRLAPSVTEAASITVTSGTFPSGGTIPVDHSCDGKEVRPPLTLSAPPPGTKSLVVIVDDPDSSSGLFTHMILFDVDPSRLKLAEGTSATDGGPDARYGSNDFGSARYGGPCPPHGELHRYRFRVIAADRKVGLTEGATRAQIFAALDGHILGEGSLTGTFGH